MGEVEEELKVKVLSLEEAIRLRKNGAELTKIDLGFETEVVKKKKKKN